MQFVAISDTHNQHQSLVLPPADAIIHAGDVTSRGSEYEVVQFMEWFTSLDYKYKIFIAGNHDFFFEQAPQALIHKLIPQNVIYLNDSLVEIASIKIWGSPISPWFYNWAFNRHRGEQIKKHWDLIPNDIDIIITHGPAYDVLDTTANGDRVGCKDLKNKIQQTTAKVHICGHIHEAYGPKEINAVKYINASVLNLQYNLANKPILITV